MRFALLPLFVGCAGITPIAEPSFDGLSPEAVDQIELGRTLFFDPGLSSTGDVSCASCHDPEKFGADGLARSIGVLGTEVKRNAPSVFNAALKSLQFWDGRAATLEEQATGPLFAEDEMGNSPAGVEAYLTETYPDAFATAFPGEPGPTVDQLARALAAYERMLPAPSRVDRFLQGDPSALDAQEQAGFGLFRNNCAFCHGADGVGGDDIELLGDAEPWPADRRDDLGVAEVTGDPRDELRFVVPSLRNVAQTGPWFHDGSVETLEEAVELMGRHQVGREFDEVQTADLVAFLEALDAETVPEWAFAPDQRK